MKGQGLGTSLFLDCWSDVLAVPALYVFTEGASGISARKFPEPNVDFRLFKAHSKARLVLHHCSIWKPLLSRMLGFRRRPEQHSQKQRRNFAPLNNDAARQPECDGRTNGDFSRRRDGHIPIQLSVEEERNCNWWRDFFDLHDTAHDSFRQSCTAHGGHY